MLTTHLLSECHRLADWFVKDGAMCYHVYVIMHVKDLSPSVVRVGFCVLVTRYIIHLIEVIGEKFLCQEIRFALKKYDDLKFSHKVATG